MMDYRAWKRAGGLATLVILLCAPGWADTCPRENGRECQPPIDPCPDTDSTSTTVQLGGEGSVGTEDGCSESPAKDAEGYVVEANLQYRWDRDLDPTLGTLTLLAENVTCLPSISKITTIWINTPEEIASCSLRTATLTNPGVTPQNACGESSCTTQAAGKSWTFGSDTNGEGCLGEFDWEFDTDGVQMGVLPGGSIEFVLDCTGAGDLDELTACDVAAANSSGDIGERRAQAAMHFQNTDPDDGELSNKVSSNCQEELYVELAGFDAIPDDSSVTLEWHTALEVDNAGFRIKRRDVARGETEWVTDGLIAAEGDIHLGAHYRFVDDTAINGVEYEYTLVDVELTGLESEHPGRAVAANPPRPAIRLARPAYGASSLRLGDQPVFEWASDRPGTSRLLVSADPTFADAERTIEVRVRQRSLDGAVALNLSERLTVERIALDNNGLLYWKVLQSDRRDGSTVSSPTYSLSYGVLDQADGDRPSQGNGWGRRR